MPLEHTASVVVFQTQKMLPKGKMKPFQLQLFPQFLETPSSELDNPLPSIYFAGSLYFLFLSSEEKTAERSYKYNKCCVYQVVFSLFFRL